MADHNALGTLGEACAKTFLQQQRYVVLDTNFRWGKNEIDIVALHGDFLVFVEVKTRHSSWAGTPEAAVTKEKQRSIVKAASGYVERYNRHEEIRFDIVSVLMKHSENPEIVHIPNAFSAEW